MRSHRRTDRQTDLPKVADKSDRVKKGHRSRNTECEEVDRQAGSQLETDKGNIVRRGHMNRETSLGDMETLLRSGRGKERERERGGIGKKDRQHTNKVADRQRNKPFVTGKHN